MTAERVEVDQIDAVGRKSAQPSQARHIFRFVVVSHRLEIAGSAGMTFLTTYHYELEALMKARFFENRYTSSGTGIEKAPTIESGRDLLGHAHHRLHGPVIYDGPWRILLIDLGRDVDPGDRESVEIKQTFIHTSGTCFYFGGSVFSAPQLVPEKLVIEVQLHRTMRREVRWQVRRVGERAPSHAGALAGQDGLYTWDVPNIEANHNYRIDWSREQR